MLLLETTQSFFCTLFPGEGLGYLRPFRADFLAFFFTFTSTREVVELDSLGDFILVQCSKGGSCVPDLSKRLDSELEMRSGLLCSGGRESLLALAPAFLDLRGVSSVAVTLFGPSSLRSL